MINIDWIPTLSLIFNGISVVILWMTLIKSHRILSNELNRLKEHMISFQTTSLKHDIQLVELQYIIDGLTKNKD